MDWNELEKMLKDVALLNHGNDVKFHRVAKLRKVGNSLVITIPKKVAEGLNLKEDSHLELVNFTQAPCLFVYHSEDVDSATCPTCNKSFKYCPECGHRLRVDDRVMHMNDGHHYCSSCEEDTYYDDEIRDDYVDDGNDDDHDEEMVGLSALFG